MQICADLDPDPQHCLGYRYLNNIAWIRIRMDPELLPGSGSGSRTREIQSWS